MTNLFDGIFNFYYTYYPNSSISNLVKVRASSSLGGRGNPIYVIDPAVTATSIDANWISQNIENSSFTVIFQRDKLMITSYSLRARLDKNINTPLEWIVEGSNDLK